MTGSGASRLFSIPPGVAFLPTLAEALVSGRIVPGFSAACDPLSLASSTIYVPTRRAARELRSVFVDIAGTRSAVLPSIRPLGEFEEDAALFESSESAGLDFAPPIAGLDRLLLLAPLVQAWKHRLPAHVAEKFSEDVVVPASAADAIWLARDLSELMDEIETEGADWTRLTDLVGGDLAGWWQVTLEFLEIVTGQWPTILDAIDRSNPAAHRSAMILAEAARLEANPPDMPIIAAGSTGSIPATARLLSVISRLPQGAVILPGLDLSLDRRSWEALVSPDPAAPIYGHPQFGLGKLLGRLGAGRDEIVEIGLPPDSLGARARIVSQAFRPAETTDDWAADRAALDDAPARAAFGAMTLVEAANEREEAVAIALALRRAIADGDAKAALVTGDRDLARRTAAELRRFGIKADDSGGTPLARTPPATLMSALVEAVYRPGNPVAVLELLKHPLLDVGHDRAVARRAAETIELVALRGGTGRPDIAEILSDFERGLKTIGDSDRKPFWWERLDDGDKADAKSILLALQTAVLPLVGLRDAAGSTSLGKMARVTTQAVEALGRNADGGVSDLYNGDAGNGLAAFLRALVEAETPFDLSPSDWPDILAALLASETVKPSADSDSRIAIWGALEARLQHVDTLVLGGLNEGSWPRRAEPGSFMSRMMKSGMTLEPPERRIGLAAHDFTMALGAPKVVLTRSARAGDAPAVASRWLQRLTTFAGKENSADMRARGDTLLAWARGIDLSPKTDFVTRPRPTPPQNSRPRHFSVTEIETLRRDPYAIYARKILGLRPLDPLLRDPGAAERGILFHDILHGFTMANADPLAADATERLIGIALEQFRHVGLPPDVEAVWWPRFARMAPEIIDWERARATGIATRHAEAKARGINVGASDITLSGRADRIDVHKAGMADILDYKTGSSPSKGQAHTLLAPQLALEGALLMRGAFADVGVHAPSILAHIRLKANGRVEEEPILEYKHVARSAEDLATDAWNRLEALFAYYADDKNGYLSRALPFREDETSGDYDHLARVLEWSSGGDTGDAGDDTP